MFGTQLTPNSQPQGQAGEKDSCRHIGSFVAEFRDWDPGLPTPSPQLCMSAVALVPGWLDAKSHPRFRFSGLGWSLGVCTFFNVSEGIQIGTSFRSSSVE